jgi:hypothetical protein
MNARLTNTDPEILHRQTETCSAVAFLLLETTGKYFDLQMGAVKSSLDTFRSQCDLLAPPAEGKELLADYAGLLAKSIDEGSRLLREGLQLSAGSQRQFGQLMDQGWLQLKEANKDALETQLALAARLGQSLTASSR